MSGKIHEVSSDANYTVMISLDTQEKKAKLVYNEANKVECKYLACTLFLGSTGKWNGCSGDLLGCTCSDNTNAATTSCTIGDAAARRLGNGGNKYETYEIKVLVPPHVTSHSKSSDLKLTTTLAAMIASIITQVQ